MSSSRKFLTPDYDDSNAEFHYGDVAVRIGANRTTELANNEDVEFEKLDVQECVEHRRGN